MILSSWFRTVFADSPIVEKMPRVWEGGQDLLYCGGGLAPGQRQS